MRYSSANPKTAAIAVLGAFGIALFAGTATASVDLYCDCTPTLPAEDYCCEPKPTLKYCECDVSNAISGMATHQYNRHCTEPGSFGWDLRGSSYKDVPKTQVRNIPSNVTCTEAWSSTGSSIYYFNQCTNWNLTKKSVTVITYRGGDYQNP